MIEDRTDLVVSLEAQEIDFFFLSFSFFIQNYNKTTKVIQKIIQKALMCVTKNTRKDDFHEQGKLVVIGEYSSFEFNPSILHHFTSYFIVH